MATSIIQKDTLVKSFGNNSVTISGGTIGTYAVNTSKDVSLTGYTPVLASMTEASHSSSYIPCVVLAGTTLYFLFYRTSTGSYTVPASDVTANVYYVKS